MSTASTSAMPTTAAYRAMERENRRLSATDAIGSEVSLARPAAPRATRPSNTANNLDQAQQQATLRANVSADSTDVSQTFYEWLSAVRELQKDPWERKKTIISFVMLVFHTGVDAAETGDSLTKEQLEIISKAPGWNENEHKMLTLMKDHFSTIKELSGSSQEGITYLDLQSLFSSKKKIRDVQLVAASTKGAKSGCAAGLCIQILLMVAALQMCLGLSLALAIVGALVGLVMHQNADGAIKTAVAGALWGVTGGSAIGAYLAAKQAELFVDHNLCPRIDNLRQDLKTLRFE